MVWFRVDDGFATSRKVLSIPIRRRASAIGVWTLAGTWSAGQLTDGFVPHYALDEIPDARRRLPDLVSAHLWELLDTGIQFHDWQDYQPARAEVLTQRQENTARQKAYRDRKKAEREAARNAATNASPVTLRNSTPTRPDPTRPDRSSFGTTKGVSASRAGARTRTPKESTGTQRAREAMAAGERLLAARALESEPETTNHQIRQ